MSKRALAVVHEVVAFRVSRRGSSGRGKSCRAQCDAARMQPRRIDHDGRSASSIGRRQRRQASSTASPTRRPLVNRASTASDPPACSKSPRNASIREWLSTMPVEATRVRRRARTVGSSARTCRGGEPLEIVDAVRSGVFCSAASRRSLRLVDRDDRLCRNVDAQRPSSAQYA